ncbi:vinculin family protein [Ostertagia ostertagi]
MPVFHTKTIENILEPVAQQLHYVLAVAERNAGEDGEPISTRSLSRASSRRSLPEFIYPDTIKQRVTEEDCPVCQIMLPKGRGGCVRVLLMLLCLSTFFGSAEGPIAYAPIVVLPASMPKTPSLPGFGLPHKRVSRLVILHEEAEDGNAMPDLTRPVGAVSRAVDNLIKVGYDTCHSSDDQILQQDMPPALQRVETSSRLLEDACHMLKGDPFSVPARKKLIDGARGILQGTSALLLCFDESEVRKIIRGCRKVLDYLAVAEVIESIDDLAQFVKDITPWLSRVSSDVSNRQAELTHQVHRDILCRMCYVHILLSSKIGSEIEHALACTLLDQITERARRRFSYAAMKILSNHRGSRSGRNYLAQRMTDEMHEIIRVLQLTTYDEDEWDADNVTVMRKALPLLTAALDWLGDPRARPGAVGEKAIRRILDYADRIGARALPEDSYAIKRSISEIASLTDTICELRNMGRYDNEGLAISCAQKLKELVGTKHSTGILPDALMNAHRVGGANPAHTAGGRLEQALRWLDNPGVDDGGLGLRALKMMTDDARRLADRLNPQDRGHLLGLCSDIDRLANQLADLERRGLGNTPEANAIRQQLKDKLRELSDFMRKILTDRVVEDFADITTPLKQFVEAVHAEPHAPNREGNFIDKIDQMTPQLVNAGKIRNTPTHFTVCGRTVDDAIDTHEFVRASETAMRRYTNRCEDAISNNYPQGMVDNTSQIARLGNRVLMTAQNEADNSEEPAYCDRVNTAANQVRSGKFQILPCDLRLRFLPLTAPASAWDFHPTWAASPRATATCHRQPNCHHDSHVDVTRTTVTMSSGQLFLPNAICIENASTDPRVYISIPPMVTQAKQVAISPRDTGAANAWRTANDRLLDSVRAVGDAIAGIQNGRHSAMYQDSLNRASPYPQQSTQVLRTVPPQPPTPPIIHNKMIIREEIPAPPRPPPPVEISPPPRPPPPPEYDEEEETRAFWERYPLPQASHQPILSAAHSLHNELKQWSSQENEIVAAAKRMAISDGSSITTCGTKKDLIECAKAIADSSEEVTRLAVQLARLCTDLKMRMALLQMAERIPTIATQLKVCSTVKSTMFGTSMTIGPYGEQALLQMAERIPTIATQLKVCSTVKSTMFGTSMTIGPYGEQVDGSEEDIEAMEQLAHNAQNLMLAVKDTVRAAEAASIKIKTNSGLRLRWVRKPMWSNF